MEKFIIGLLLGALLNYWLAVRPLVRENRELKDKLNGKAPYKIEEN